MYARNNLNNCEMGKGLFYVHLLYPDLLNMLVWADGRAIALLTLQHDSKYQYFWRKS